MQFLYLADFDGMDHISFYISKNSMDGDMKQSMMGVLVDNSLFITTYGDYTTVDGYIANKEYLERINNTK